MSSPTRAAAVGAALFFSAVAGCASAPAAIKSTQAVVTDPRDYAYLNEARNLPHVHDYWGGQQQSELANTTVSARGNGDQVRCCFDLGQRLVNPGTVWVNVSSVIEGQPPPDLQIGMEATSADGRSHSLLAPAGQTHVSLQVSEEMNDVPHSHYSRWTIAPRVGAASSYDIVVHFRLTIGRDSRPLPVSPPHPDFWQNETRLTRYDTQGELSVSPLPTAPREEPPIYAVPEIVPFGTSRAEIRLHYNSSPPSDVHYRPILDYRTAASREWRSGIAPTESRFEDPAGLYRWVLNLNEHDADSPYARNSTWALRFSWLPNNEDGVTRPIVMDGDFHLTLVAERAFV